MHEFWAFFGCCCTFPFPFPGSPQREREGKARFPLVLFFAFDLLTNPRWRRRVERRTFASFLPFHFRRLAGTWDECCGASAEATAQPERSEHEMFVMGCTAKREDVGSQM